MNKPSTGRDPETFYCVYTFTFVCSADAAVLFGFILQRLGLFIDLGIVRIASFSSTNKTKRNGADVSSAVLEVHHLNSQKNCNALFFLLNVYFTGTDILGYRKLKIVKDALL